MTNYQPNAENALRQSLRWRRLRSFFIGVLVCMGLEGLCLYFYSCCFEVFAPEKTDLPFLQPIMNLIAFFSHLPQLPLFLRFPSPGILAGVGHGLKLLWPLNLLILLLIVLPSRRLGHFYGVEHGSARWTTPAERKMFKQKKQSIPLQHRLWITPADRSQRPIFKNLHKITFGSTGSGKTFRDLIPELLAHSGCYVASDVQGVLYMQTAHHMQKAGYRTLVFNLLDMKYSLAFNGLEYIERDQDVTSLVANFILNSRKEGANAGDQFWEDSMELVLGSIIRYLVFTPGEQKNLERAVQLFGGIEMAGGRVASWCEYERIMEIRRLENPFDTSAELWRLFKQAPAETLQSVLISLSSRLKLWTTDDVKMISYRDEFHLRELMKDPTIPTVIYLIIPPTDISFKPLSAMFFQTLFNVFESVAVNGFKGRLPQPWTLLMDECANLGKIPQFASKLTLMRKFGVRICPYFQSYSQVKELYKEETDTIISSCAIYNYLGVDDPETHKKISEKLGETTIEELSSSSNRGNQGGGSDSRKPVGRKLMMPDEIAQMPTGKSIVFISGIKFYGDKIHTEAMRGAEDIGIEDRHHPHCRNNRYLEEDLAAVCREHREDYEKRKALALLNMRPVNLLEEDEEASGQNVSLCNQAAFEQEMGYADGEGIVSDTARSDQAEDVAVLMEKGFIPRSNEKEARNGLMTGRAFLENLKNQYKQKDR